MLKTQTNLTRTLNALWISKDSTSWVLGKFKKEVDEDNQYLVIEDAQAVVSVEDVIAKAQDMGIKNIVVFTNNTDLRNHFKINGRHKIVAVQPTDTSYFLNFTTSADLKRIDPRILDGLKRLSTRATLLAEPVKANSLPDQPLSKKKIDDFRIRRNGKSEFIGAYTFTHKDVAAGIVHLGRECYRAYTAECNITFTGVYKKKEDCYARAIQILNDKHVQIKRNLKAEKDRGFTW
jgi:hypothetical protein